MSSIVYPREQSNMSCSLELMCKISCVIGGGRSIYACREVISLVILLRSFVLETLNIAR